MARRGVMTALQAALAGIGGAAGGYVQMEDRKRKQLEADRERERQEQRDLILYGREAITPGPLATRAPAGQMAPEMPAGAPPSAIPMPTGKVDFGGAMQALEQEEARPSGTEAIKIGDRTLYIPVGQRYRDMKRSEAIQTATEQAQTERDITQRFRAEDTEKAERSAFNFLKKEGKVKGEFDPNYGRYVKDEEDLRAIRKGRAMQAGGAGETSEGKLRETFVTKYFSEYGELPKREQTDEFVRLARGGRTIDDLFPADGAAPATPPARQAPMMAAPTGGMFARDMFAPTGAAAPQSNAEEIRALASRLAELSKGRMGSIADRERYASNAAERSRVQAALDAAQRNYRR